MVIRLILVVALVWMVYPTADSAAECKVVSGTPTYNAGKLIDLTCDTNGKLQTNATGGGGGSGDASLAEQQTQTGILTTIDSVLDTIATYLDGVETKLDSIITATGTTLAGYLDGVETLITSTNTKLDSVITGISTTLAGYLDGVEGLLTTIDADTGNISTKIDTIAGAVAGTEMQVDCVSGCTGDTELPAAAALADNTANPTVPGVGSYNMCFDGSTWDRCVQSAAGAGSTTSATQRVVEAYDSGVCNPKDTAQVAISVSSSGNNELVALTSAQTIYICDLTLISNGTVGVQLIYGTGTACATGETNMSGVLPLVANSGWTHDYAGRLKTAEANAFCLELSGAVQVDGILTYRKAATF
jgi:hypothetical protein